MDGNLNDKVVCCFCGQSLKIEDAMILLVYPNIHTDENQQLFCHKEHFIANIDKSIFLHPDFFEEED